MGVLEMSNEGERLAALVRYRILDTPTEGEFDRYARRVAVLCGTEIGAVTLLDRDRQWIKAVHGPLPNNIPRDHAFCSHTILEQDLLEVPDALLDPRFANSRLVRDEPHIRFYAGAPLLARNHIPLGSLCVMSLKPGHLSPAQRRVMLIAASHITAQLELRLAVLQLGEEKKVSLDCRQALADSNRRQQDLTALLVHDFKGPLTAVALSADWLAEDSALTDEQRQTAREIVEAGQALAEMVNDLLDVSRLEDGHLMLQRSAALELADVARASVERLRLVAAARQQRLEVSTLSPATRVSGDPKILARVVNNLVDNACKYAPAGSAIVLELSSEAEQVVLRVGDKGPGIPEALRDRVFDKYFQVDQGASLRPSHGLGLAFCRLAIEAHHGTIEVENQPLGCVFRVTLPRTA